MTDFGAGDIVKGIELALKIYSLGFVEENSADNLYQEFREDINSFQSLLWKLDRSLKRAHYSYSSRGLALRLDSHDPLSKEFEKERKAIVGPFLRTLEECKKLLDENKALRMGAGQRSSPFQNIQWHLSQQDRVKNLRDRLQFHAEKIRFVIDRLKLDKLTDLDAKADDILAVVNESSQNTEDILLELNKFRSSLFGFLSGQGTLPSQSVTDIHVASPAIAARLQENLSIDAPQSDSNDIPLTQGFDALLLQFQHSISGIDQTSEKYLAFLKTRWLLARVKDGKDYRDARPGLYYKRAICQIERAILARAGRPADLMFYDDAALISLPSLCFQIWPPPTIVPSTISRQLDQLTSRANELKAARIELLSDGPHESVSVTIFRKSDKQFRVVQEIVSTMPNEKLIMAQQVDTSQDVLIPRYALPTLEDPCLEIAIFSRNEETLYTFRSLPDLWRFQTAFTGYDVSFDHVESNIHCQFSNEVKSLDCRARIQIWQEPIILASAATATEITGHDSVTSLGSPTHRSGENHSRHGSVVTSIAPTTNISPTIGGWEAGPLKLSAITIFTQLCVKKVNRFAVIFIELQEEVYVRPNECNCHRDYDKCSKLVLAGPKGRKLPLRVCYSDAEDPNSFDILPFRIPRSSEFHKIPVKHTEFVVLKFATLEDKRRFHQELEYRFKIREKQIQDQHKFRLEVSRRQNHPQRRDSRSH